MARKWINPPGVPDKDNTKNARVIPGIRGVLEGVFRKRREGGGATITLPSASQLFPPATMVTPAEPDDPSTPSPSWTATAWAAVMRTAST